MLRRRQLVAALVVLLSAPACRRASPAPVDRLQLTLTPASFGTSLSLQQHVHVEYPDHSTDVEVVLDIAPDAVTMIGIAFGQRVLTIRYDGVRLTEQRHPLVPSDVRGGDILTDLQVALWPIEPLRAGLPSGYSVEDVGNRRTLTRNGATVLDVAYDSATPRTGHMVITSALYGYRVDIRSAKAEP